MKPCPTITRIRAGVMKPYQLAWLARIRICVIMVMNVYVTGREGVNYTIYVVHRFMYNLYICARKKIL